MNWKLNLLIVILIALTSACNTRKNVVFFQEESSENTPSSYTPVLQSDDLLAVRITADDPETAERFNLPVSSIDRTTNSGYSQGNPEKTGSLIDENGEINMPIIGRIKIAGLKRTEAIDLLEKKLEPYLKNPIVNIQILNYKITILGDVKSPGTFKIPNERLTLIEAIGLAGDVNISAKRTNVLVVRDVNGLKTQYRVDLTQSDDVFNSPVYYLKQNDVVYVEPNFAQRSEGAFWKRTGSIFISLASIIISTISVVSK